MMLLFSEVEYNKWLASYNMLFLDYLSSSSDDPKRDTLKTVGEDEPYRSYKIIINHLQSLVTPENNEAALKKQLKDRDQDLIESLCKIAPRMETETHELNKLLDYLQEKPTFENAQHGLEKEYTDFIVDLKGLIDISIQHLEFLEDEVAELDNQSTDDENEELGSDELGQAILSGLQLAESSLKSQATPSINLDENIDAKKHIAALDERYILVLTDLKRLIDELTKKCVIQHEVIPEWLFIADSLMEDIEAAKTDSSILTLISILLTVQNVIKMPSSAKNIEAVNQLRQAISNQNPRPDSSMSTIEQRLGELNDEIRRAGLVEKGQQEYYNSAMRDFVGVLHKLGVSTGEVQEKERLVAVLEDVENGESKKKSMPERTEVLIRTAAEGEYLSAIYKLHATLNLDKPTYPILVKLGKEIVSDVQAVNVAHSSTDKIKALTKILNSVNFAIIKPDFLASYDNIKPGVELMIAAEANKKLGQLLIVFSGAVLIVACLAIVSVIWPFLPVIVPVLAIGLTLIAVGLALMLTGAFVVNKSEKNTIAAFKQLKQNFKTIVSSEQHQEKTAEVSDNVISGATK